jgi:hypothetical protein
MATATAAVAAMATAMVAMVTATVAVAVAAMAMAWMATATAAVAATATATAMAAVTTINSKEAATAAAEELDDGRDGWRLCIVFFVIRQIGVMFHLVRYFFSPSSPPILNAKATERSLPQGASRACCLCRYPRFAVVVVDVVFVFFRCLHRRRHCVRCHHRGRRRRIFRWIF